jgi:predicted  nucleic acid-binding Zn-ribbon protein
VTLTHGICCRATIRYAAIEVELNERRAREKVSAGLKVSIARDEHHGIVYSSVVNEEFRRSTFSRSQLTLLVVSQTRLEDQLQQLREEAKKLRESTVSAKTTVTETLKGKLSAVQAKNKVEEELAKTLEELR